MPKGFSVSPEEGIGMFVCPSLLFEVKYTISVVS